MLRNNTPGEKAELYIIVYDATVHNCKMPSYPSSFLFLRIGLLTELRGLRLIFRSWILMLASCSAWACWMPATTAWNDTGCYLNQEASRRPGGGCVTLSIIIWAEGSTLSRASVQLSQGWAKTPSIVNLSSGFTFRSLTAESRSDHDAGERQRGARAEQNKAHLRTMSLAISEIWLHSSSGKSKLPVMIFFLMSFGMVRLWCLE